MPKTTKQIKAKAALEFNTSDLPNSTRIMMAQCLETTEMDEWTLWADINAVLDCINDGHFDPVALPDDFEYDKPALKLIPKEWWTLMAFHPAMEKKMKAFWKKNPESSIYWS